MMLEDKVDFFLGSHNSAAREALIATIKGKAPYVYTPIYEGGECSPNLYCLAETPQQQMETALPFLAQEEAQARLSDRQRLRVAPGQRQVRKFFIESGGKVVGEEYVPFGAPNKFEEAVTRIKAAKPDVLIPTLVRVDNVNFNRTFAGFGLDKKIARLSLLLEENTLLGIGAETSANLYCCMGYFANIPSDAARPSRRNTRPSTETRRRTWRDRRRLLLGAQPRQSAVRQGRRGRCQEARAASDGRLRHRLGPHDDAQPARRQEHVPGPVQGHAVRGHRDPQGVKTAPPAA